jgi:hypothetical protein
VTIAFHGVEQQQITQLGTAVKVVLRKDIAVHHHGYSIDVGIAIPESPGLCAQWLALKWRIV